MKRLLWIIFVLMPHTLVARDQIIERRFVPTAQTASIAGNWALWHNPAGLAFMGGSECAVAYHYEWSDLGNRHHANANVAINLWRLLTLGGGIGTEAAFSAKAKTSLGSDLKGIFGAAINLSPHASFGSAVLRSHNFQTEKTSPWLWSFGLQIRPYSFLSLGGHYEENYPGFFGAPNITAGISGRPYKEIFTIGLDNKWVALGPKWNQGFRYHPILSVKTDYKGFGLSLSAEIPGLKTGFSRPIFEALVDINFSHFGLSLASHINSTQNNYTVGSSLRISSEEWPSVVRPADLWVELFIDHDGKLEQRPQTLAEKIFSLPSNPLSVLALLKRIENDQSIAGLVLHLKGFSFGDGQAQEWHEAILSQRQANKEVIVYLDSPSERDYYVATAANKVLMNKHASLSLRNFQATLLYFADMLQKIGIKADAVVAGYYKTFPRQWTNRRPQKEEVEMTSHILSSFYEALVAKIAETRNLDKEQIKTIFDHGEITASDAKKYGLVDDIVDGNDVVDLIDPENKLAFFPSYENRQFKQLAFHRPKKIAVIPIDDAITDGRAVPGIFSAFFPISGADDIVDEIDKAVEDSEVLGIIVRINSPGGDGPAGHKINHALMKAQKIKPVVTSMSDIAASAGYLIASASHHILAQPNTITGSIGVFSLMFSGEKLANKIGIFSKELKLIKNPGPTVVREMTPQENQEAQKIVDWHYANFVQSVSDGLKMDQADVLKNADGRIWLGHEALEKKLIHQIGGFAKAIDVVRDLSKIPSHENLIIDIRTPGFSEQFSINPIIFALFNKSDQDLKSLTKMARPYLRAFEAYRLNNVPQARLPFDIVWSSRFAH